MTEFIYIPVNNAEMQHIVNVWNAGRVKNNKAPYRVIAGNDSGKRKAFRHKFGGGLLRGIGAADKLYVLQHGFIPQGSNHAVLVGADRGGVVQLTLQGPSVVGGQSKTYTPTALAEHLEKEELSKSVVDLRLFCCGSGVQSMQNNQAVPSYAEQLKAAMTARGYNGIFVTGYLGNLSAEHSTRLAPGATEYEPNLVVGQGKGVYLPGDKYATLASNHRVQF